ncbi:MAG: hypothetical protein KKE11_00170, partial [Gammaproteobacteria bacterium]|nr:hypothetical protein [Gammaproteobacteria bacterium]
NKDINKALMFAICCGLSFLVIFQNITADVPHPDNLQIAHFLVVFLLSWLALQRQSFKLAVFTMVVAGIGCFTKQTETIVFLGPLALFVIYRIQSWPYLILLATIGLLTTAISLFILWWPEHAFFYTYTLPANNVVEYERMLDFGGIYFWGTVPLLTMPSLAYLWKAGGSKRRFLMCWLILGIFVVVPNIRSFLKFFAQWNNLVIVKLWLLLIAWPCLLTLPKILAQFQYQQDQALKKSNFAYHLLALFFMLSVLIPLYPKKILPLLITENIVNKYKID